MLNQFIRALLRAGGCAAVLAASGCVLSPRGTQSEANRARLAGAVYDRPPVHRQFPPLPQHPTPHDIIERAMLADGQLESAYFQWSAALQRVTVAGTYPNTDLTLGLSYMLNGGASAWNRTTVTVSPDMMQNLNWPAEVSTAAKAALQEAKAAGARYAAMRREVRRRALKAWLDYALSAEQVRLQKQDVQLLELAERTAGASVSAGGDQRQLLDAQVARAKGIEKLHELESMQSVQRATLNAMLHRPVEQALTPPSQLPHSASLALSDGQVLALAARNDPQLAELIHENRGRGDLIKLAKMQYLPDFNPEFSFTGNISRAIGAGFSLPLVRLPAIRAMIRQAHDQWRSSLAQLEQAGYDRSAEAIAALVMMRHYEHDAMLFEKQIRPAARQVLQSLSRQYAAGSVELGQLIDAQRTILAIDQTIAEARVGREKSLADLEAIIGKLPLDAESMSQHR